MTGYSNVNELQSKRRELSNRINLEDTDGNEPPAAAARSICMDSLGTESIQSELQSIQIEAFESEKTNHLGQKKMKKMLSKCADMVDQNHKLSKLVDETIAKVEKARKAAHIENIKYQQKKALERKEELLRR